MTTDPGIVVLAACLLAVVIAAAADIEHVLVIGSPGSGKSVGAARDALASPGSVIIQDPHSDSLATLVLSHVEGRPVLYDRLSDLRHPLGYGLLRPSTNPDPRERRRENLRRAELFSEVLVLRGGAAMASTPQRAEWTTALLLAFLHQDPPKDPEVILCGLMPSSDHYRALVAGCTEGQPREKIASLAGMSPRAVRAEVGSTTRIIEPVLRSEEFLARCRPGCDVGAFLQTPGAVLLVEGGGAPKGVVQAVTGGINLQIVEHCEHRPVPYPLIENVLDECTNAGTAGDFEQRKAGETRKLNLRWKFMCQWPNFPGGDDGFMQNCVRKEIYQVRDHTLARRLAAMLAAALPATGESRAARVEAIVSDLMTLRPGERWVTCRAGTWRERVPLLADEWPDWPGLREAKLAEKLQWIYSNRPEYRTRGTQSGGGGEPPGSTPSQPSSPSPPPSSPPDSSPAARWKRGPRPPRGGSSGSGSVGGG